MSRAKAQLSLSTFLLPRLGLKPRCRERVQRVVKLSKFLFLPAWKLSESFVPEDYREPFSIVRRDFHRAEGKSFIDKYHQNLFKLSRVSFRWQANEKHPAREQFEGVLCESLYLLFRWRSIDSTWNRLSIHAILPTHPIPHNSTYKTIESDEVPLENESFRKILVGYHFYFSS